MVLELSGGGRGQFLSREGRGRMHCGCAGLERLQRLLNYYNSQRRRSTSNEILVEQSNKVVDQGHFFLCSSCGHHFKYFVFFICKFK